MSKTIEQQFTDWVRKQDPEGAYKYTNARGCAFAKFLKVAGYAEEPACCEEYWVDFADEYDVHHPMPQQIERAVKGFPETYGALLSRLEAARRG